RAVAEAAWDRMKCGIEHVHGAGVEVGGVEAVTRGGRGDRETLVHGARRGIVDRKSRPRGRDPRIPAEDRAALGRENETSRTRSGAVRHDEARSAVEDHTGRRTRDADSERN